MKLHAFLEKNKFDSVLNACNIYVTIPLMDSSTVRLAEVWSSTFLKLYFFLTHYNYTIVFLNSS